MLIHEIHSNFSILKPEFEEIFNFLYLNPELSFKEKQCSNFLCDKLGKYEFKFEKDFLETKNSFFAKIGSGHPKVALIFDMDASCDGHTKANNLAAAIMCSSGILMSKLSKNLKGSINIFGCSGECISGTKITLLKQGAFKDINYMFSIMPYTDNYEELATPSSLSLSITFSNKNVNSILKDDLNLIMNFIKSLKDISIYNIELKNSSEDSIFNIELRSDEFFSLKNLECSLTQYINSNLSHLEIKSNYYNMPYCELKNDQTLKKILITNLKQSGIIDFKEKAYLNYPLSLGNISHEVPIYLSIIDICENKKIKYDTKDFYLCSNSIYAKQQSYKAIEAICLSIFNLINK